jgi:hypothetical protein
MRTLSAVDMIQVWEIGQRKPGWFRDWLLLSAAYPERPPAEVAQWSIGTRNCRLLALRRAMRGSTLHGYACCSRCQTALEFSFESTAIESTVAEADRPALAPIEAEFEWRDIHVRIRALTTLDLMATADEGDRAAALAGRSVDLVSALGEPVPLDAAEPAMLEAIESRLAEIDPGAVVNLGLACAACAHEWSAELDIGDFLWREVALEAERLMSDVHVLARTYGWREADILAMSAARRAHYLSLGS